MLLFFYLGTRRRLVCAHKHHKYGRLRRNRSEKDKDELHRAHGERADMQRCHGSRIRPVLRGLSITGGGRCFVNSSVSPWVGDLSKQWFYAVGNAHHILIPDSAQMRNRNENSLIFLKIAENMRDCFVRPSLQACGIGKKLRDSDSGPTKPNTALKKKNSIFEWDIRLLYTTLFCSTLLHAGFCCHVVTEYVQLQLYCGLDYLISQSE